jgi:hypothetical protein
MEKPFLFILYCQWCFGWIERQKKSIFLSKSALVKSVANRPIFERRFGGFGEIGDFI